MSARRFIQSSFIDMQRWNLKQRLLQCVKLEQSVFLRHTQELLQQDLLNHSERLQLCRFIIRAAGNVLSAENWSESFYLSSRLAPIETIYQEVLGIEATLLSKSAHKNPHAEKQLLQVPDNKVAVYISLYQMDGYDLDKWARQLAIISEYRTGRPIYREEANVCRLLRARQNQVSEAYAMLAIDPQDIIPSQSFYARQDQFGAALLNVLPHAITVENIIAFVHRGITYVYENKKLYPAGMPDGRV